MEFCHFIEGVNIVEIILLAMIYRIDVERYYAVEEINLFFTNIYLVSNGLGWLGDINFVTRVYHSFCK